MFYPVRKGFKSSRQRALEADIAKGVGRFRSYERAPQENNSTPSLILSPKHLITAGPTAILRGRCGLPF
jgi:hypothetical protein